MDKSTARRLYPLEIGAWCAGLLCVALLFLVHLHAAHTAEAAARLVGSPAVQGGAAQTQERDLATYDGVIGRLTLPQLGLSVPILNDYDPASLRQGVGRIRGTGVPGGLGNFVVAGHRDTYFRPLRRIATGMVMHVETAGESFDYVVDSTKIVLPSDVDVLDIGDRPEMTLITCYPFDYVGAAPKRFIVRGHLVSVAGDAH